MEDTHPGTDDLYIRGDRVGLGPIRADLLTTYQRWMNNLHITRTLGVPNMPMTTGHEQAWLDGALTSNDPTFTIYTLDDMRPIGNTGLHDFSHANNTCYFGILIGERNMWGQGYGTEVTRLMLHYAFDVLGIQNVMLTVHADNTRGIRAYERAGFHKIGVRRNAIRVGRRRIDEVLMDAIPKEIDPSDLDRLMRLEN